MASTPLVVGSLIVPNDIVDRILQCAPTFSTLHAIIRVSRAWNQVYRTRPKSILQSVAENVVAPAPLHEALSLQRFIKNDVTEGEVSEVVDYNLLQKKAGVVRRLEAVFSMRYRAPLSQTSQLAWPESQRFARAMYRIMLYCAVAHLPDDEDQLRDLEENQKDDIEAKCVEMLDKYATQELLELNAALVFLRAMALEAGGDVVDETDEPLGDTLISTGPEEVLLAHQYKSADVLYEAVGPTVWEARPFELLSRFFATPLQRIWDARNVEVPPETETEMLDTGNPLLDAVTYRSAPCDRCASVGTTPLWSESNWTNLSLDIRKLLKGHLARNFIEMEPLDDAKPEKNVAKLMAEIHALKSREFKGWESSDALCDKCVAMVVSEHLHLWLLALKLKDGEPQKDCWYGYNCESQTKETLHAMTKNHLCAPTKDLPVV